MSTYQEEMEAEFFARADYMREAYASTRINGRDEYNDYRYELAQEYAEAYLAGPCHTGWNGVVSVELLEVKPGSLCAPHLTAKCYLNDAEAEFIGF